jgi:hypothetical protein
MARGACLAVRLKLSGAGPSFAGYETCNDHVRDRRPCRLCRPAAGLRRGSGPAGSGARGHRAASRRDDVHARQSPSARSAWRRKPQPPAIASTTPWRYARAERRTARARSVAAGTMPREAFPSRQTPRDRGRRSDRRAGGEDGRRPDSPHGRRAALHRGRIRARGHGPHRAHRSDGRRCSRRGSRVTPRSRARRHDLRAGGGGDHRADNRCGRRDARLGDHSPGRADAHGRSGWGRSKSSSDTVLSVFKMHGRRGAAFAVTFNNLAVGKSGPERQGGTA